LNCVADCPESGIRFRFFPQTPTTLPTADLKRRSLLTGLAAGAVSIPLMRADTGRNREPDERLIRPPGALDEAQFLARCVRCGECIKVCPTNALHPAFSQAGWEGLWTPLLAPRVGFCEPGCTLCGEVCPTGAIWQFTAQEKGWAAAATSHPIRLGTAFYDRGRCLPWAMATECVVCQEWCPVSPKAIYLRPAEVTDPDSNTRQMDQPYINPEVCVGCGACEYACPVHNPPAVYVTSVGESRSKSNQLLLKRATKPSAWLPGSGDVPGWTKSGETRQFAAADLWKYVDGDAERYLKAGVRDTLTATYRFRDNMEAVVDIYRMQRSEGAKSIFESEPSNGSHRVSIGDAARSWGQSLTFRKGTCFVRLAAYQDTPQTEAALIALGQGVATRLAF
jgi:ferredoxin